MPMPIGIVLAAGKSCRFGADKRQHVLSDGQTVLQQTISNALQVLSSVTVVLGADDAVLQGQLLERYAGRVQCVLAGDSTNGMARSLAAGVAANRHAPGWVVLLGDMPFIQPGSIAAVAAKLQPATIVQPVYQGRPGHPVAFAASFGDDLLSLQGDQGARSLIDKNHHLLLLLSVTDPGIHQDVDTVTDLLPVTSSDSGKEEESI